jgi:hypothetical protein
MSFPSAVQSAVFYILACTPCTKVLHQHKTRKEAKKAREAKARIVLEQPHLYRHPDPFHTNPYWEEEIQMGPSLQKKRKPADGKTLSQRRLTAASRDGRPSIGTGSSVMISMSERESIASPRPSTSPTHIHGLGSAPTVVPEEDPTSPTLSKTVSVSTSGDWNLKRYQREDEELWGNEPSWSGHKLMDAIKQAGSSAGRYMESKLGFEKPVTEEDRYNFYFTPRNPPVNDYHPPVVSSKPMHKDALRWMLQPPPPAKVMDGKVPVSRSPSMMSAASRRTVATRDGGSLGRLVGEKAFEARLRNGESPREGEVPSTPSTPSLARTRSRMTTVSTAARTRSRRTVRTYTSSTESDTESDDEYLSKSLESSFTHGSLPAHAAQKPRLPTIMSSGADEKLSLTGTEKCEPIHPLRAITNSTSELDTTKLKIQPALSPLSPLDTNVAMRA